MGKDNIPTTPAKLNESMKVLKDKMNQMESKIKELEKKNKKLEDRVEILESDKLISSNVADLLAEEVDKLSQYTRRANLIVRNVFLPETESADVTKNKIIQVIKKELNMPEDVIKDIDKMHRIGKVKKVNDKNNQDVIIRFKSHSARYRVYNERKKLKIYKIAANLTKNRGKVLYDAVQFTEKVEQVHFVYADAHGNLKLRLKESYNDRYVFSFNSVENLKKLLLEMGYSANPIA